MFVVLLLTPLVVAQRYDNFASVTTTASGVSNLMQAIPNAKITVCNFPGTGGFPCTNLATTFTDQTLSVSCPAASQVTLNNTNVCVANGDALGNFGFWIPVGTYQYCISAINVNTQCYNIVVPGTSTGAGPGPSATTPGIALPARFSEVFYDQGSITAFGQGITCLGTQAGFAPTATETAGRTLTSAANASTTTALNCGSATGANPGTGSLSIGTTLRFSHRMLTAVTSSFRFWIGVMDATAADYGSGSGLWASDTPNRSYCNFRFSSGTDTNWKAICATSNVAQTVVDTGISPSNVASFLYEITFTPIGAPTQANFFINGTQVATISSNLPALSTGLSYGFQGDNKNTATAGNATGFWTQVFQK